MPFYQVVLQNVGDEDQADNYLPEIPMHLGDNGGEIAALASSISVRDEQLKKCRADIILAAQNEARFADADSSNYVALRSPSAVGSNVIFTLPNALGTNGQVLSTNATGDLSWLSAGTVISVTGTAPISVATGTTTPVISMAKATAGADGYLSSGDFSTFFNKLGTASTFSGDVSGTSSTMTLATVATAGTYSRVRQTKVEV